ncbi:MAG: SDR family oxidoreductase [Hyphomicrobium sp.]|nr:SDR family oxidoreductase [Hyphomicrobium sp.]
MSVISRELGQETFPELAGSRVVITGLTPALGVDIARGFAERKARLSLQAPDVAPETTELVALLSQSAAEVSFVNGPLATSREQVQFAQRAAESLGGIDVAVNLILVSSSETRGVETEAEIEELVARKLGPALRITQVIANRMRVTWSEGTILNAVIMPAPASARELAIAGYMRAALAAMTKGEAAAWGGDAIRINAVGPKATPFDDASGACLTSEPDLAALALTLASHKGRKLTGYVFDAEGIARRGC